MNIQLLQTRSTLNRTVLVALFSVVALLTFCSQSVWADNYYLNASQPGSASWFTSSYWTPNNNPSSTNNNNYYVGEKATGTLTLRTEVNDASSFQRGHTLYLGYNLDGSISSYSADFALKAWTVTVDNLQLGNTRFNQARGEGTVTVKGAMSVNGTALFNANESKRIIDFAGSIAGAGTITINTVKNNDTAIKISSTNNAFTGDVVVNENSLLQLTGENALSKASNVTLNSGSTLELDASQTFAENSVIGSGTLKTTVTQGDSFLNCIADTFTGTITISGSGKELRYVKPLDNCTINVENGSMYRAAFSGDNVEINSTLNLNGNGFGIGGSNSGAFVNHGTNSLKINGTINVQTGAMIGCYGWGDTTLAGITNTNGNTLEFRQTRNTGSVTQNVGNFFITGDVTSPDGKMGIIQFAHDTSGNVVNTHLYIGDSTASETATIQTINANVINKNKNELVFQPGENRTVIVKGTLKNESGGGGQGKGFIKNGAGTLELTADSSSTLSSKTTINAGTVKLSSNGNLGTGEIALNGGTLEFAHDTDKTFTNKISGNGTIVKTGAGTLSLSPTTEKPISATTFNVDAGTLKFSGKFTGNLLFNDEGILSMDDSVSSLTVDGQVQFNDNSTMEIVLGEPRQVNGEFQFNDNSTLLFEQNDKEMSQLVLDTGSKLSFADDSVISIAMDSPILGEQYTLITSTDAFTGDQAKAEYWNSLLSPSTNYYWNLSVSGNQVFAQIDPNAVPEPSTWALLMLGFAGLMKVASCELRVARKRERQ